MSSLQSEVSVAAPTLYNIMSLQNKTYRVTQDSECVSTYR